MKYSSNDTYNPYENHLYFEKIKVALPIIDASSKAYT